MRFIILLGLGFCLATFSNAAVLTVNNSNSSPGQYTSAQDAHDAAVAGDTLYIHGTGLSYGTLSLIKPLVIIGSGALPNRQVNLPTFFSTINLSHSTNPVTTNSHGSTLIGLKTTSLTLLFDENSNGIGNLYLKRCLVDNMNFNATNASSAHPNIMIQECIVEDLGGSGNYAMKSSFIGNSIIRYINMSTTNCSNVTVKNCILDHYIFCTGFTFENNIFYSNSNFNGSIPGNVFNNNLLDCANSQPNLGGTGNVVNQDPQFVVADIPFNVPLYNYAYQGVLADFHLQSGSPAEGLGSDGTDAGIYGGGSPFHDGEGGDLFRYYPMPNDVPQMISMDILNYSVPSNGTLNVNFNARVQD